MAGCSLAEISPSSKKLPLLSLGVSTVETNRDQDRDFSTNRVVLFKQSKLSRHIEMSFFKLPRSGISIETLTKIKIYWDLSVIETVKTWILNCWESLDCQDVFFQTVEKILTVKMSFFKISRLRFSIESMSRQI
jgi:hypothetical protein